MKVEKNILAESLKKESFLQELIFSTSITINYLDSPVFQRILSSYEESIENRNILHRKVTILKKTLIFDLSQKAKPLQTKRKSALCKKLAEVNKPSCCTS